MTDDKPWKVEGTYSWMKLRKARRTMERHNADLLSDDKVTKSIKDEEIFQFTTKKYDILKPYKALLLREGGEYGFEREWLYNELFPSSFEIGDIIEVGWTIPHGNLKGHTVRLYFVVLLDTDGSKIFYSFAERSGREATPFNPIEREMKYGYRGEDD